MFISTIGLGIYYIDSDYSKSVSLFVIGFIVFSLIVPIFYIHTSKFPRNKIKEYSSFSLYIDNEATLKGFPLYIEFLNQQGLWKSLNNNITLDLRGYIFPKQYIKAFLIRQIKFKEINRKSLPAYRLFKGGMKLDLGNRFYDLTIQLVSQNKKYNIPIVTHGQVQDTVLTKHINRSNYWIDFIIPPARNYLLRVVKFDEEKFKKGHLY